MRKCAAMQSNDSMRKCAVMQSNDSGYDSAAESVSSSEAIRAVNSLVRADLHEVREAFQGPPLLLYRDREADRDRGGWNKANYAPETEFTEGGRCNGGCSPCLFHNTRLGCPRGDACRYCHEHDIGADRVPHRPRKTLRHKIKRNAEDLLRRFEVSPERVHDELQVLAAGSQFAVNFLAGRVLGRAGPRERQRGAHPTGSIFDDDGVVAV